MLGSAANVMIVPMSRPWKTVQDFIAAAKMKDASIAFGSVASAARSISAPRSFASPPASRPPTFRTAAVPRSSPTSSAAASISTSVRWRRRCR
jgi:hypothetical protein